MRRSVQRMVRAWSRLPGPRTPAATVLGYHRIDEPPDGMTVRPATFLTHMRWLSEHMPVVAVDELAAPADGWPQRSAVVTIDDAWADVHDHGLPVLAELKLPATLYVPSGLLGTRRYMRREQVVDCHRSGMAIGGHSRSHADLRRCGRAELEREVRGCREDLEDLLGAAVTSFAYPFGLVDPQVRAAVAEAGYATAVTTARSWARPGGDALMVPRSIVEELPLTTFAAAVNGGFNLLRLPDAIRSRG